MSKKYATATIKTLLDSFDSFYRKRLNDEQFKRFVELMAIHPEHIDGDEEEGIPSYSEEYNELWDAIRESSDDEASSFWICFAAGTNTVETGDNDKGYRNDLAVWADPDCTKQLPLRTRLRFLSTRYWEPRQEAGKDPKSFGISMRQITEEDMAKTSFSEKNRVTTMMRNNESFHLLMILTHQIHRFDAIYMLGGDKPYGKKPSDKKRFVAAMETFARKSKASIKAESYDSFRDARTSYLVTGSSKKGFIEPTFGFDVPLFTGYSNVDDSFKGLIGKTFGRKTEPRCIVYEHHTLKPKNRIALATQGANISKSDKVADVPFLVPVEDRENIDELPKFPDVKGNKIVRKDKTGSFTSYHTLPNYEQFKNEYEYLTYMEADFTMKGFYAGGTYRCCNPYAVSRLLILMRQKNSVKFGTGGLADTDELEEEESDDELEGSDSEDELVDDDIEEPTEPTETTDDNPPETKDVDSDDDDLAE